MIKQKRTHETQIAPYGTRPGRGRFYAERGCPMRGDFQRDRDRIIHSAAFRRLQYKTQVFVYHEGDHFRTRLTHSLEVSQIARALARALGGDEDLAEAIALAHDLGHSPFGHAGETALQAVMAPWGGFDHNEQTFRVLTFLESRYADFDGLNLSWETLEGIVKHNGPLCGPLAHPTPPVPESIAYWSRQCQNLELEQFSSLEAQIAAIADDIAYHSHDLDDGIRSGLIRIDDLRDLPVIGGFIAEIEHTYPGIGASSLTHELVRCVITGMVADVIVESTKRLHDKKTPTDIRCAQAPVVAFSDSFQDAEKALRRFLFRKLYRHPVVNQMMARVKTVVKRLFNHYAEHRSSLPQGWCEARDPVSGESEGNESDHQHARRVADYIAGMTDRYAFAKYRKFFNEDLEIK